MVKPPSSSQSHRKPPPALPYCVLHYYTTSAVRTNPAGVSIIEQSEVDVQLVPMQEIFAETFLQLQQELSEESARSFKAHSKDPLAILLDLNKKRRKKPPLAAVKNSGDSGKNEGGFLRNVPLPERLLRTQQQQAQLHAALTQRMNRAAKETTATTSNTNTNTARKSPDISQRRKSSRKSIWNVVMDEDEKQKDGAHSQQKQDSSLLDSSSPSQMQDMSRSHGVVCSCSSHDVEIVGSSTSRNQDMAKGETWGNKDRSDEVITRYRCDGCGKTWNEEE
jgi:hypothetical protein